MYVYLYITKFHIYIDIYATIIIWVVPFTCQKTKHDEYVLQNKSFSFVKWCMLQFIMDLISFHRICCDGLQLRLSEPYKMQTSILNPQWKKISFVSGSVWCEWQKCIVPCRILNFICDFCSDLCNIFCLHYNQK